MAEKKSLLESWIDLFRFNRRTGDFGTRVEDMSSQQPIKVGDNEQVIDFGVDYVSASLSSFLNVSKLTSNRYRDYDIMDKHPLINNGLDIIASEAIQEDEQERVFQISIQEDDSDNEVESARLAAKAKMLNKHLDHFIHGVFGNKPYIHFRNLIKQGDLVLIPIYNEQRSRILKYVRVPIENIKLVIDKDTLQVTQYIVVPPGAEKGISSGGLSQFIEATTYRTDDVFHFQLFPEDSEYYPYGKSLLDPIALTFKMYRLQEEALLVYRITRAPERRVFYIDVGELPPAKAEQYINNIRSKFVRKNFFDPNTGEVNNEYNPLSMQEDLYIPRRPSGAEAEVQTLPGAQNLDSIGDIIFFRNQIILGLKIPPSYLDIDNAPQYNDGRVGVAYINEIRFASYIETLQREFVEQVETYFRRYLKRNGIEIDVQFKVTMTPPSSYKEYKYNELELSRISNYSNLASNEELSKEFLMEKYLKLTPEEIQRNRELLEAEQKRQEESEEMNSEFETPEEGEFEVDQDEEVSSEEEQGNTNEENDE